MLVITYTPTNRFATRNKKRLPNLDLRKFANEFIRTHEHTFFLTGGSENTYIESVSRNTPIFGTKNWFHNAMPKSKKKKIKGFSLDYCVNGMEKCLLNFLITFISLLFSTVEKNGAVGILSKQQKKIIQYTHSSLSRQLTLSLLVILFHCRYI